MNMLKRSLAMLLVLCMLFSAVPFSVFAEDTTEPSAVTEVTEQQPDGPGNSEFGHAQGKGKDKQPEATEPVTEATEETVPATTEETVPATTEETVPATTEETVPATTEETVSETTEETVPATTEETVSETTEETVPETTEETVSETTEETVLKSTASEMKMTRSSEFIRVFHVDAGRKYFTVDELKGIIDQISAKGYTHLELAFGNEGLRFLLDDMTVTVGETTYSSDAVTKGIQEGNKNRYNAGDKNELTEAEMDSLIAYADSKHIEIIPLLNTPGHMNALLDAMEYVGISSPAYSSSNTTVDLQDSAAIAFTKAFVKKYVNYFSENGCNYFNLGADEYAADVLGDKAFSTLQKTSNYLYDDFANYINDVAEIILDAGMTPIAFNDGIYYNKDDTTAFNKNIVIAYWIPAWGTYYVASPAYLVSKGHLILNTNDDWYYVLGKNGLTDGYGYYNAYNGVNNTPVTKVADGSTMSTDNLQGAMMCLWCDSPSNSYEANKENVTYFINTWAAKNSDFFVVHEEPEVPEETEPTPSEPAPSEPTPSDPAPSEPQESVTVTDEITGVEVTAPGLTAVNVTAQDAVATEEKVAKTYSITLNDGAYTAEATVKVPYDTAFDGCVVFSGEVDGDIFTVTKEGDWFICEVPHFSDITINGSKPSTRKITVAVGEEFTVTDTSGNYGSGTVLNDAYAQVVTEGVTEPAKKAFSAVTAVNSGSAYIVTNTTGNEYLTSTATWTTDFTEAAEWTFTASGTSGNGYTLKSGNNYLRYNYGWTTSTNSSRATTVYFNNGTLYRTRSGYGTVTYSNDFGKPGTAVDVPAVNKTDITFTGVLPGNTSVMVGNTTYNITVIKAEIAATIEVDNTQTFHDNSANITVDNESIVTATPDGSGNLIITAKAAGTTTVSTDTTTYTITVVDYNLSAVTPLKVEYWITNIVTVLLNDTSVNSQQISAATPGVATAKGADLHPMMPDLTYKKDVDSGELREVEFWHVRLLDKAQANNSTSGTEEQTTQSADDETTNGDAVTRVRYYDPDDGKGRRWQLLSGDEWLDVTANSQVIAYYMESIDIQNENGTKELHVTAADWGKLGDNSPASSYADTSKYCSISLQIVYEDGSTNPATTTANDLDSKTLIYNYWDAGRGIGTFAFDTNGQFEIYQISAETGAVAVTFTGGAWGTAQVTQFTWDDNEKVVWTGESETASIYNNASHPSSTDPLDNLMWNENKEAILIRVYVRAVETEESLTVVYIDEKFNDTLYTYNIQVPTGDTFNNKMIGTPSTMENGRINVTGCGINNLYGQKQNFQTDLTKVPEAKGKYDNDLYTYTGSKISEDGKTLYLYYNIDTSVLSPNFVIDFGLPITFDLADVTNTPTAVTKVSASARYGNVVYNSTDKTFTYTPTQILPNIDVLSISLTIAGTTATTNVGVTPATTVHYEESFINWDSNWKGGNAAITVGNQATEVLGNSTHYGYDAAYANNSGASNGTNATTSTRNAVGTFTFTGDGIQVFANTTESTGYVSVEVKNSNGKIVNLSFVNTVVSKGDSSATTDQTGNLYGLPVVSLVDLQNIEHGTYTVTIKKIRDDSPVTIDGIRVFNTIKDTRDQNSIYLADEEDNPSFTELRDTVLHAIGVKENISVEDSSVDYKTMYEQVYNATAGANALITDESVTYANSSTLKDMLDNGPKNEIYLFEGQTLTFKVKTSRVMQVGLKAPNGATQASISIDNGTATLKDIKSSVDMFYTLAGKSDNANRTVTVAIKNTGSKILSVTLLKICDDPNYSFVAFSEDDVKNILNKIPLNPNNPVEPEKPTGPEKPTQPTDPEKPNEPVKPNKPIKLEKPLKKTADATLKISLVDKNGKVLATTKLKAMGMEGDTAKFDAKTILKTAKSKLPSKYKILDEDSVSSVNVEYGAEKTIKIQIGKVATLKVTYINLKGKKVGTATLTKVQTSGSSYTFSASAIRKAAPKGYSSAKISSVKVSYGKTKTLKVTVF